LILEVMRDGAPLIVVEMAQNSVAGLGENAIHAKYIELVRFVNFL
jgi:hypothetical protein